jgi:hypothetical protein
MLSARSWSVFPSGHSQPQHTETKEVAKSVTPLRLHSRPSNNGRGSCFFIGLRSRDVQRTELAVQASPLKRGAVKRVQNRGAHGVDAARARARARDVRITLRAAKTGRKTMLDAITTANQRALACRRERGRPTVTALEKATCSKPSWTSRKWRQQDTRSAGTGARGPARRWIVTIADTS